LSALVAVAGVVAKLQLQLSATAAQVLAAEYF
jgi:hypothetical protein